MMPGWPALPRTRAIRSALLSPSATPRRIRRRTGSAIPAPGATTNPPTPRLESARRTRGFQPLRVNPPVTKSMSIDVLMALPVQTFLIDHFADFRRHQFVGAAVRRANGRRAPSRATSSGACAAPRRCQRRSGRLGQRRDQLAFKVVEEREHLVSRARLKAQQVDRPFDVQVDQRFVGGERAIRRRPL
jgi:hypothetical protein